MADKVGGVYIEIQARMGNLEKDLRTIQSRMQQVDGTGAKFAGTMAKLGGVLAGGAIAYGLLNIGKSALSAAANMEQQKVAFTSMLGSAEKAQKLLDQMQSFAASTPFQFNEIVDAGKKLVAFGENADNVTKTLGKIGDVASGLGIPLGELTEIYGKARVQQTLYAEDLNQLAGRGIPIFEELAKVMGVNASEVKKLGSEGKISFSMLEQVFGNLTSAGGKFAGLMDAQSQTLAGKWSNFNDQLDRLKVTLGDEIAPSAGRVLGLLSNIVSVIDSSGKGQKEGAYLLDQINAKLDGTTAKIDSIVKSTSYAGTGMADLSDKVTEAYTATGSITGNLDEWNKKYGKITTAAAIYNSWLKNEIELTDAEVQQYKKLALTAQDMSATFGNMYKQAQDVWSSFGGKTKDLQTSGESPWKKRQAEAQKYFEALKTINTSTDDPAEKVEQEIAALNEGMNKVSDMYKNGEIKKKQYEDTLASYSEARIKKEEELEQAKFDRMKGYYDLGVSTLTGFSSQVSELVSMYSSNQTATIDQESQKRTDALNEEYAHQIAIIEASNASDEEKAAKKKALDEKLARDTKAIEDKAAKDKRKAQREAAKIQKDLAIFETIITTPQAAMAAYASLASIPVVGPALGAAAAIATTALGIAKLKLIQDQPLPALAEGGIVPAIPGGRTVQVAEAGSSEAVIPLNDRGVEVIKNIIGTTEPQVNLHVYINDDYKGLYKASKNGYVTIDKRAVV